MGVARGVAEEGNRMKCLLHPEVTMDISLSAMDGGDFFQDVMFKCPKHDHGYCVRIRACDLLRDTRSLPDAEFEDKLGKSLAVCEEGAYEPGPC